MAGEPGVIDRLAATGLVGGEADFHPVTPQHPDHADPDLRVKLVDNAGDEEVSLYGTGVGQISVGKIGVGQRVTACEFT